MKTLILILTFITIIPQSAMADCTANAKVYSSCFAGYYLSGTSCVACAKGTYKSSSGTDACSDCPDGNAAATTASTGSTSATSCYVPSSSTWSFSDTTGSGSERYTSNCYYN